MMEEEKSVEAEDPASAEFKLRRKRQHGNKPHIYYW